MHDLPGSTLLKCPDPAIFKHSFDRISAVRYRSSKCELLFRVVPQLSVMPETVNRRKVREFWFGSWRIPAQRISPI